jgi:hypothetical protein
VYLNDVIRDSLNGLVRVHGEARSPAASQVMTSVSWVTAGAVSVGTLPFPITEDVIEWLERP